MKLSVYTLEEGIVYRVTKSFEDYYKNQFTEGEKLTYASRNFSPYQGGHTIFFKEKALYLQEDINKDIIDAFDDYLQEHDASGRIIKVAPPAPKKKNGRWEAFGYLLASLIFVAIGIWIVFYSGKQDLLKLIMGWLGIIFFGLGSLVFFGQLIKPKDN